MNVDDFLKDAIIVAICGILVVGALLYLVSL